jgi:hypothetical protein
MTIGFGRLFSFANQRLEVFSICLTELYILFFHPTIFIYSTGLVKIFQLLTLQSTSFSC